MKDPWYFVADFGIKTSASKCLITLSPDFMVTAVLYYQSQRRCAQRQLWILRKDREGCRGLSSTYPCQCSVAQMCHALQRRQGSRPAVCRHSSIKGEKKIRVFFFCLSFSFSLLGKKHYKAQDGNKGVSVVSNRCRGQAQSRGENMIHQRPKRKIINS